MSNGEIRKNVHPIYKELRGYFSVAPSIDKGLTIYEPAVWTQYNQAIDELNTASGKNYDKFKLVPKTDNSFGNSTMTADVQDYLSKLSGLINRVQGDFNFPAEGESQKVPTTVVNTHQTQMQSQAQQQNLVVDLALQIATKKNEYAEGTPERTFLDDLGDALKTTKTASEVMATIFSLASKLGLGVDFLMKIFGHK